MRILSIPPSSPIIAVPVAALPSPQASLKVTYGGFSPYPKPQTRILAPII